MHELALCDAMLKMVRDISREQALEGVRSITVRVGTLSGVVPRFLTDCWTAVTDGTEYDGVPLRIETEAGRARCLDCGAEFIASRISPARTAVGKSSCRSPAAI
jgi:hydrogenase nickel incorporation protein HypA/HybF